MQPDRPVSGYRHAIHRRPVIQTRCAMASREADEIQRLDQLRGPGYPHRPGADKSRRTSAGWRRTSLRGTRTPDSRRWQQPCVVVPIPDNLEQAYSASSAAPQSNIDIEKAGTGVYFVTGASHHSVAVEFRNYVAVIESPVGDTRAVPMFDAIRKQFPNKSIRYVIENKPYYERILSNRHTINPDRLEKIAPSRKPSLEAVHDKRVLSDGTQTLELYKIQGSNHADTMWIAYLPKDKLLIEADMWNPPAQPNRPPTKTKRFRSARLHLTCTGEIGRAHV